MKKSTSLIMGIMTTLTLLIVILLSVMLFFWLIEADTKIGDEGSSNYALMVSVGVLLYGILLGAFWLIIYMAMCIPHYFLYRHDKHRMVYFYQIRFVSIISLVVISMFLLLILPERVRSSFDIPLYWFAYGLIGVPFVLILIITKVPQKKSLKK